MKRNSRLNVLLVEIVIATLFFMLASTVILRVYSATHKQSVKANLNSVVQNEVQNLAEECYTAKNVEVALEQFGFQAGKDCYIYECDDYTIKAVVVSEVMENGTLRTVVFSADIMGENSFTVPSVRYFPEVAAQ